MSEQKSYFPSYEWTTPILRDTDASSRHGESEKRQGQTIIVLPRIEIFIKRIQITGEFSRINTGIFRW